MWLNVSSADQPPTWTAGPQNSGTLDTDNQSAPSSAVLKIVQNGKRYVLHQRGKLSRADWLATKRGNTWSLAVRIPPPADSAKAHLDLVLLKPFDDDPQTQDKVAAEELGK